MQQSQSSMVLTKTIAFTVMGYGFIIITDALLRQAKLHAGHDIDILFINLPLLIGISYAYLGSLLIRRKYNAWITALILSAITFFLNGLQLFHFLRSDIDYHVARPWLHVLLPLALFCMLLISRTAFRVKSDVRSFRQALQVSLVLLMIAFLYGIGGFLLLDSHDFHQHIGVPTAIHQTIYQFGLTDELVVAHSKRARLFLDSLPVISIGAVSYVAISFFQPLRVKLTHHAADRDRVNKLLDTYPGDIDDFFKLWPQDKLYYFDSTGRAGLAYHVNRGVALVAGDPFGDKKRFSMLLDSFLELCFVNDWLPGFLHTSDDYRQLYEKRELRLQKIGEEAKLNINKFTSEKKSKYFRQINNRFHKLDYKIEILNPPHLEAVLTNLQQISYQWLGRPGRVERGFLLGYHTDEYMQLCQIAVLKDADDSICGYMNLVPTFETATANYDLLRCADETPGNANDYLLQGVIDYLITQNKTTLNLGLCPLAGLDEKSEDASIIDSTLRFAYANGDRFYSFSGLQRFKAKYEPTWEPRYIAYPGGIRNFTRIIAALNRVMKVK